MTQICTATQGFGLLHRQDLARMLLTHSILCSVYETCQRDNKAQSLGGPDRQTDGFANRYKFTYGDNFNWICPVTSITDMHVQTHY